MLAEIHKLIITKFKSNKTIKQNASNALLPPKNVLTHTYTNTIPPSLPLPPFTNELIKINENKSNYEINET